MPIDFFGKTLGNVFNEEEPEIMRSIEKRCKVAVEHIVDGINCLKYFDSVDFTGKRKKVLVICLPLAVVNYVHISVESFVFLRYVFLVLKESYEEEQLNMAHPGTAIPMPYEPLKPPAQARTVAEKCESILKPKKKKISKNKEDGYISWVFPSILSSIDSDVIIFIGCPLLS